MLRGGDAERGGRVADHGAPPGQLARAHGIRDVGGVEGGEQHSNAGARRHVDRARRRVPDAIPHPHREGAVGQREARRCGEPDGRGGRHGRRLLGRAGGRAEEHRDERGRTTASAPPSSSRCAASSRASGSSQAPSSDRGDRVEASSGTGWMPAERNRRTGPCGGSGGGATQRVADAGGRDLDRHRDRAAKDLELAVERSAGVVVRVVEPDLLATAQDEDHPAQHHERPQRRDLVVGQGTPAVERRDRGQGRGVGGSVVVQHRRHRHRDLPHGPRLDDVAEVDDGVGECAHAVRAQDVVVGDVEVTELSRQGGGDGCRAARAAAVAAAQ